MSDIPRTPGTPRCLFSYYGGKSKIAAQYPVPKYPLVIEPFGGSGAYAFRHAAQRVWLNDARPEVAAVYQFLGSPSCAEMIARYVHPHYHEGECPAQQALSDGAPLGLAWWLAIEARSGKYAPSLDVVVTKWGAIKSLAHARARFTTIARKVGHWMFTGLDYRSLPDVEATWFIDPPYTTTGHVYQMPLLNYTELAHWCRARKGHVMVCEQAGASWLDFQDVDDVVRGMQFTAEVVWQKEE